jgi:hopanoid biosynthesis associated protein HpnK
VNPIQLIVNADDFGFSHEVNRAVIRAYREGVLTSCSLMVSGEAFEEAVRLARGNPGLGVGIHLVTVSGRSVLPPNTVPALVDSTGHFSSNPTAAGLKYFFSKQARFQLYQELAAQFERFHNTGLPFSHIDGHLHMQLHPVIFKAAIELGARYNVRRLRVPHDDLILALRFDRTSAFRKVTLAAIFGMLSRFMKNKLRSCGFLFPERVYGLFQTGKMNEAYFLQALKGLNARSNEIYFHPAVYDIHRQSQLQAEVEFDALTSQEVMERLERLEIKCINYFELEPAR